ncbi:MAG TPA: TetR/AcrR family transcriptional regulator [Alphaproteobacteria bacterium]|nr:TetR/AcrR family transcriptional regulator [Alphaproteobacteria bacterium]
MASKLQSSIAAAGRRAPRRGARPYHHGNLPEALAAAAEALVRERGVHAFSLRECARRAGVTHSAPGHHFGDITGLLTEVAARGFERLTARMRAERGDAEGSSALHRIGRGYVAFAVSDPVIFLLMFHSDRVDRGNPKLQSAGAEAFGELVSAVAAATGKSSRDEDALRFAWSGVHGMAMLLIDRRLKPAPGERASDPLALAEGTIARIVHTIATFR